MGLLKKIFYRGTAAMTDRVTRLRNHQKNIDRYRSLLTTKLSETERRFLEKRVSEERFAIAMLEFMSPSHALQTPRAKERAAP